MSKEAQRTKQKRNSSDRFQLMRSNLREGFSKGIRNFSDEYLKAVESMKAPEKKQEKKTESKPMTSMDIAKFNAGLKSGAAPADTLITPQQTLSGYHDSRPIPESNAEGIGRAENDMGKEATKPKQQNQMDRTDKGRPGGSISAKPKNQMNETITGRPGGAYKTPAQTQQPKQQQRSEAKPKTTVRQLQKVKMMTGVQTNNGKLAVTDEIRNRLQKGFANYKKGK